MDYALLLTNSNIVAFLEMIRHSEGTATPNGYSVLFGGKDFVKDYGRDFSAHPHIYFNYKNKVGKVIRTSAAGAYQIIWHTWLNVKAALNLPDFSPKSQDEAALKLISDAGAIDDIVAGHFVVAINKVRQIWASLPGSGCNQPEHTLAEVEKWYEDDGGKILDAA